MSNNGEDGEELPFTGTGRREIRKEELKEEEEDEVDKEFEEEDEVDKEFEEEK